jgi:hypothetical protein
VWPGQLNAALLMPFGREEGLAHLRSRQIVKSYLEVVFADLTRW